ncbi:fibroblast growth factor 2-like [Haliotis rubra]|uniref:fibroblast growth factor 2-like n=1 Tax=Haliotis rubra TaxID=36100 RepID=UPI001EE54B15|nr:fibroblast growth factor 2-like [Haliotis rubra]XP_046556977.1 fibroblast growth factor 2-like [Haliotis rubra]XP_046556978.1 fibroblast growth factor 2-like [Haliotis rubra]XP_046556979.1 fibroblast growth factor 2-like [Haliotis rubra]
MYMNVQSIHVVDIPCHVSATIQILDRSSLKSFAPSQVSNFDSRTRSAWDSLVCRGNELLVFYVSIVCCMVVTEQSGTAYTKPKLSEPPIPNSHPRYWQDSVRQLHLQSKNNWYIAITKDGHVSGSREKGESAVLIMTSGINKTVAMKGKHANKFLCVNNDSKVYASDTPNERHCYFVEEYNTNDYNMYRHSFHRRGDRKVYLAIDDDGTIRLGNSTDNMRIYFLPLEPKKKTLCQPIHLW